MGHIVIDGANVVGSRPDRWWRDRPRAARRLAGQLVAALIEQPEVLASELGASAEPQLRIHLVLEGAASAVQDLPTHPHLEVHHAAADGDAEITALAGALDGDVLVVTADRALGDRVRVVGASVAGPSTLLNALSPPTDG